MTGRLTTSPVEQYLEHLSRGELGYQADEDGRAVFFPRVTAPNGFSGALTWKASAGLGTVYATTYILPKGESAYNVSLVDMDEGFRLMSRVEGITPDKVRIGMRVKTRIHPAEGDEGPYPVFDPAEAA